MITVTVPIYNMEKYLARSIPTILNQSYDDYEVILVDDGSTDNSLAICEQFAADNPRIRVFHKENGGLSTARNCGIDHARGDYIIFPDPDDWVEQDYLEMLMRIHEKYGTDMEICGHYICQKRKEKVPNSSRLEGTMDAETALRVLRSHDDFGGYAWNKLFHMDIIRKYRLYFDVELLALQDLYFCYQYLFCCSSVAWVPKPLYHYDAASGVHSPNTPLTNRKMSGLKAFNKIAALAGDTHPEILNEAYSALFNISMIYMYAYINTGMKESEKLEVLKTNLKQYKSWFFNNKKYSPQHKLLGRMALLNPRLFYICSWVKRYLSGTY